MDVYVYYRAAEADAQRLQAAVATLQGHLRSNTERERQHDRKHGLTCGLKRRPESDGARHTWMEIYLDVPDGFEALLNATLPHTALPDLINGDRHIEYFLDCLPCA